MIKWTKDEQSGIVHAKYIGSINEEELLDYISEVYQSQLGNAAFRIVEDARNATYEMTLDVNKKVQKVSEPFIKEFEFVMSAFIQDKPIEAIYNRAFEYLKPFENMKFKVFNDYDLALDWIKKDFYTI